MRYAKNQDNTQAPSINEQNLKGLVKSHKNRPVTTSRIVAQFFEKNHKDVLRDIQNLEIPAEIHQRNFAPVKYKDAKGELRPMFELGRDGFFLLVMGYTGKKAMQFKLAFIDAFNKMEQELQNRQERTVLQAQDFIRLAGRNGDFEAIMSGVLFITDDWGRKCYHYFLALEKIGFSTRSGQVWKRERRNPSYFVQQDNATYIDEEFLYNMFIGRVKAHNDKIFRAVIQPKLPFNDVQIKGGYNA